MLAGWYRSALVEPLFLALDVDAWHAHLRGEPPLLVASMILIWTRGSPTISLTLSVSLGVSIGRRKLTLRQARLTVTSLLARLA